MVRPTMAYRFPAFLSVIARLFLTSRENSWINLAKSWFYRVTSA
jgi:hypothetical protein